MATKTATKRKSKTDAQLEELRASLPETYLEDTNVRRALAEQGIVLDEPNATNPAGSETPQSEQDEELASLYDEIDTLDATHQGRLAADRVRRGEHPEGDDRAMRQALADDAQRVRGETLRQSLETQQAIRGRVTGLADRIGTAPTPGGIATLLVIIALLLLILIDVNGQPRLLWLWNVLLGRARLMSEQKAAGQAARLAAGGVTSEPITGISETAPAVSNAVSNGNSATAAPSNVLALPSLVAADFDRYLHS